MIYSALNRLPFICPSPFSDGLYLIFAPLFGVQAMLPIVSEECSEPQPEDGLEIRGRMFSWFKDGFNIGCDLKAIHDLQTIEEFCGCLILRGCGRWAGPRDSGA
jgi:hypothetical protein